MAGARCRALSDLCDESRLETTRGPGFVAAIHPVWRDSLEAAGWLRPAPLEAGSRAEALALGSPAGGRGAVYRAQLEPGSAVVRRVRRGGWLAPLLGTRLLGPARPLSEARTTAALRALGAPVPQPVMALAWRTAGPFWGGLVVTREEPETRNGREFLAAEPDAATLRRTLRAVGQALRRFHDVGGWHADLNLGNLLVRTTGATPTIWIIDLDRARVGAAPRPNRRMRELMRLYRSLRKSGLGDPVRCAAGVFHAYCGGDRALRTRLLRWRRVEALGVAIHALRYGR